MKISEKIKAALTDGYLANDTIYDVINDDDRKELIEEVAESFQGVLNSLVIDTKNDHNTQETAKRVAKMFVNEIFRGRYYPPPCVTAFPNAKQYDQIYMSGPITINSTLRIISKLFLERHMLESSLARRLLVYPSSIAWLIGLHQDHKFKKK